MRGQAVQTQRSAAQHLSKQRNLNAIDNHRFCGWSACCSYVGYHWLNCLTAIWLPNSVLSWILRIGTGFFAARYGSLSLSVLVGGLVAFIDATLGWYISWVIGPGRPQSNLTSAQISRTVLIVSVTRAALSFIGGLLA